MLCPSFLYVFFMIFPPLVFLLIIFRKPRYNMVINVPSADVIFLNYWKWHMKEVMMCATVLS